MNIKMIFVYPLMDIVNGEANLFRIIDNNLKESIIIYLVEENNKYNVNMFNTMTGIIHDITQVGEIEEIDKIIKTIQQEKTMIEKQLNLEKVGIYILNLIAN